MYPSCHHRSELTTEGPSFGELSNLEFRKKPDAAIRRGMRKSSPDLRSLAQHCPQVLHEQEQVIGIRGARLELQGFVPAPRLVVRGMDEQCPNTGDVGGCGGSEQCVLDEGRA